MYDLFRRNIGLVYFLLSYNTFLFDDDRFLKEIVELQNGQNCDFVQVRPKYNLNQVGGTKSSFKNLFQIIFFNKQYRWDRDRENAGDTEDVAGEINMTGPISFLLMIGIKDIC